MALPHLPTELGSGLAPVTVGATNSTFREFTNEPVLACVTRDEGTDIALLRACDVIELQDDDIGLAAVDARMLIKVLPNIFALLLSLAFRTLIPTRIVKLAISSVVRLTISPLTLSTIRTWPKLP